MKIFLDTANVEEIREAVALGLVDGVTTNPTLLSRESGDWRETVSSICDIVNGPVSVEVVSQDYEGMVREAQEHAKIHENVVCKIQMGKPGLKAVQTLRDKGIRTNVTLVFSATQALLVGKAGAEYVSPFVGRIDDISTEGMDLVHQIMTIYENYAFHTEVIVASLRHPMHVVGAALAGADIATIPAKVMNQLWNHPLTDIGVERFLADWEKVKKNM